MKGKGLFGSCFLKLFFITVVESKENTKNTLMVFFEKCSYYLNLVFFIFSRFFLLFLFFHNKKQFKKTLNKHAQRF